MTTTAQPILPRPTWADWLKTVITAKVVMTVVVGIFVMLLYYGLMDLLNVQRKVASEEAKKVQQEIQSAEKESELKLKILSETHGQNMELEKIKLEMTKLDLESKHREVEKAKIGISLAEFELKKSLAETKRIEAETDKVSTEAKIASRKALSADEDSELEHKILVKKFEILELTTNQLKK